MLHQKGFKFNMTTLSLFQRPTLIPSNYNTKTHNVQNLMQAALTF